MVRRRPSLAAGAGPMRPSAVRPGGSISGRPDCSTPSPLRRRPAPRRAHDWPDPPRAPARARRPAREPGNPVQSASRGDGTSWSQRDDDRPAAATASSPPDGRPARKPGASGSGIGAGTAGSAQGGGSAQSRCGFRIARSSNGTSSSSGLSSIDPPAAAADELGFVDLSHLGSRSLVGRGRSCPGRLAPRPILEGRTVRKGGRQAERLLMGEGPLGRADLGVTAVPMIRDVRSFVAIVDERNERTGGDAGVVSGALRHHHR